MARKAGFDVWIGALSSTQDQTFHWYDNTRITFSNWAPGKPNGDFDSPQDCVMMRTMGSGTGAAKAGQLRVLYSIKNVLYNPENLW